MRNDRLIEMYRRMVRIRFFEERVRTEFSAGRIPGFVHLYSGEEAVAVGACANLNKDDYITSTHRGHGHLIAKGGKTDRMMAELFGKETGYNKGKGGSMHIADADLGMLGANGIVGAGLPIGGGAAIASQIRKTGQVTICFLGDGATNTAAFHEAVNMASCWKLPVVYVIENNQYAQTTPFRDNCRLENVAGRSVAYGIPGVTVDGNDVVAVSEVVGEAVTRARKGEGPTLVECKTYRYHGHFQGDNGMAYRTAEEVDEWKKQDPIPRFRLRLTSMGILTEVEADNIDNQIAEEIEQAVKFAVESPSPSPEETLQDVYVDTAESNVRPPRTDKTREITYLQAIDEAVDEEMARDQSVFVMGLDIRKWGAPLGELAGLFEKYGPDRVKDTPISEVAFMGGAIGSAAVGLRPIADIMFVDFLGVVGDAILNQLQMRYMYGGMIKLPLVIVSYCGAGMCAGAQHSKNLYGFLMGVPGLKVIAPATPYDMKGLLKSAIRDDNPVISLHHKALIFSASKGKVPEEDYTIPLGKADIKREGKDVTVVAIQAMVHVALAAAEKLQDQGISVEVIDPRTLVPLDKKTILDSVKKTGRLVVVDEEPMTGSAAGEIAAIAAGEGFSLLRAPVKRVCGPDTPVPFAAVMENFWRPDEKRVIQAVKEVV